MKQYRWDIDSLLKYRATYEKLGEEFDVVWDTYNSLIQNYYIKMNSNLYLDDDFSPADLELDLVTFKDRFYNLTNPEAINLLVNAYRTIKDYKKKLQPVTFSTFPLNERELLDITTSLFKEIGHNDLYNKFLHIVNPSNGLLHIDYYKKLIETDLGSTYIDDVNHISYGLVARRNSVQDVITLAHEAFHMITRQNEVNFDGYKNIYMEVEGYFANFLFRDLINRRSINTQDLQAFDMFDLTSTLFSIEDVIITKYIMENHKNGKVDFKGLEHSLKENGIYDNINYTNYQGFITTGFEKTLYHGISYLVALDLYEFYKKEPELAINTVLDISKLTGKNPMEELEKINVTFFEDGYQNLNNKCKKLLKKSN